MLANAENALIAALKAHRDVKRLVRTVASLPREMGQKLLQTYVADAPALYLINGRFTVSDNLATLRFTVAGVVRNSAGIDQARKGDGVDIGCDHLLILIIRALNDHRIGGCSWQVVSGEMADDELFDTHGLAAVEVALESTPIALPFDFGEEQLAELDNFTQFHADLDIAPQASEAVHAQWTQTPPDYSAGKPDLQLDITLPGANP